MTVSILDAVIGEDVALGVPEYRLENGHVVEALANKAEKRHNQKEVEDQIATLTARLARYQAMLAMFPK